MMEIVVLTACSVSLIISITCLIFLVRLFIDFKARDKSTHSIQYVPVDHSSATDENGFEVLTKKTKETLENDDLDL